MYRSVFTSDSRTDRDVSKCADLRASERAGRLIRRVAVLSLLAVVVAAPAGAETTGPGAAPAKRDWDLMLFGFGWLSSVKADLAAGDATVELDESIVDLIPQLTWAVAGGVDARYRDFVFGFDALGQQIQMTKRAPARTVALDLLGGAFGGLTATRGASSASVRSTEVMAEAIAGWRAASVPVSRWFEVPSDDPRRIWLDLFGGARYWYWRTELRLSIPPLTVSAASPPAFPPGLRGALGERLLEQIDVPASVVLGGSNAVLEDVVSWTDGLIGVRIGGDLTRTVSVTCRTDVGGFGFGDSSAFSWQVMTGVQWRFLEHWVAALDWRVIGFQRENVDDALLYGAQLGVGYRF